mgnify:CR=1 FL=1
MSKKTAQQLRRPNFRGKKGTIFLVRCFLCEPKRGLENYLPSVASGQCAWCGWKEGQTESEAEKEMQMQIATAV